MSTYKMTEEDKAKERARLQKLIDDAQNILDTDITMDATGRSIFERKIAKYQLALEAVG